jgi:hypothetical protein
MRRLLSFHRWVGLIAGLGMMAWGISGPLHPLMSRLQPQPSAQALPEQQMVLTPARSAASVLQQQGLSRIGDLHLVRLNHRLYWQVSLPGQAERLYLDSIDGALLKNGDRHYAEWLARYYLNDWRSPVRKIELLEKFTQEYNGINRLLPVYRVHFNRADGMRAYVQTDGGRLGTLVDDTKGALTAAFRTLHTWSFLNPWRELKLLMVAFLIPALLASLTGIWLFVRKNGQTARQPLRRIHRVLGLAVSLTTLTFAVSGGYHLIHSKLRPAAIKVPEAQFSVAELAGAFPAGQSVQALGLARIDDKAYYRLTMAGNDSAIRYVDPRTGEALPMGDERYARYLAGLHSGLPADKISSVRLVTAFNDEYGFIFKRLPVYRVAYNTPQADVYFVETSSGKLASRLSQADRREGWFFAYIHKWAFAGGAPEVRDLLLALFALGNALVAATGFLLFWKSVQPRRRYAESLRR